MTFKKGLTRKTTTRQNNMHRNRALLETFEPRVMLAATPVGVVDVANRFAVSGWAYDPDTPATSITVQVRVDGAGTNVTASQTRNDLTPVIGSPNHGFTFNLPALNPGVHTINFFAADSSTGVLKLFKSVKITNPSPIGAVDVKNSTTVSGWAFDPDSGAAAINVRIDNNGVVGSPVSASTTRNDLTAFVGSPNHGFSVSGSFGIVDVYALDTPTSTPVLIGTNSVKAKGHVDILATTRVAGWAWTPDLAGSSVNVEVDVDGVAFQTVLANQSRPDLVATTGGANFGFDFALNALTPGKHSIQIFALDPLSTSNAKVLIGSGSLTNPAPKGFIDVANGTGVTGWAFDANAGAGAVTVEIKVDDVIVNTSAASQNRPDLTKAVGSPNHGFTIPLSSLSAGPHKIQLFALDNPSGTEVLLATKFINNTKPFGFLDSVNLAQVKGWAYDPDSPNTPVNVIVVLDGVRDVPTPANVARPDLTSILPDANHAFVISTPTHLAGTHTIKVIAVDTFTGEEVVLGTKQFTNKAPRGAVDVYSATGVSGWTQDPDAPFTSIVVLIRIDGVIHQVTANRSRPDLTPVIGSPNHGFLLSFARLATGSHFIEVFGVDPITGVSTLIGSKSIIV